MFQTVGSLPWNIRDDKSSKPGLVGKRLFLKMHPDTALIKSPFTVTGGGYLHMSHLCKLFGPIFYY